MLKQKLVTFCIIFPLILIQLNFVLPVKADSFWLVYWQQYFNYYDSPKNLSTVTTLSSADGHCTTTVTLVVSIYDYTYHYPRDWLYFRVAVYVKAIADPGYLPIYATDVTLELDKIGSNQDRTYIEMIADAPDPGYSQGEGLTQITTIGSDPAQRYDWVKVPLEFAVSLLGEGHDIVMFLVNWAESFAPVSDVDYKNAGKDDGFAWSYWYNENYNPSESPTRQYCFNSFFWKQEPVQPDTDYGLKIWAYVKTIWPNRIPHITTLPISLHIYPWTGGGGCPYVSTWNGTHYVLDNNILPASEINKGTDVDDYYKLEQCLVPIYEGDLFSLYPIQISEFEHEHDCLDMVKLLAVDRPPDVNVAVSPYGEILTYSNPMPPILAIDDDGIDMQSLVNAIDGSYYRGYNGSYLTITFAPTDISSGAKLVIRADEKPPVLKCPVYVQVLNTMGEWNTIATFYTRTYWSTDIINMASYWPDAEGNLKVRLCFISNDKIDYVGLDTTIQANIQIHEATLVTAIHTTQGNVRALLKKNDQCYAELVPGQQIYLTFLLLKNENQERTFILYTEGRYETIK